MALDKILEMLTNSLDEDDETEFTYIIIVRLEPLYFQYETEDSDGEIFEQEVKNIPSFLELHSPYGSKKCRNGL